MRKQKHKEVLRQELENICQTLQNKLNTIQDFENNKVHESTEKQLASIDN